MGRTGAVVLAGGRSSRYGSDKATAQVAGRPLLRHVLDAASPLVDEVLVVGPWAPAGYRRTIEPTRFEGPLAGLAWGLEQIPVNHALVLGCDHPALVPALLGLLLVRRCGHDAVACRGPHGPEPLVAVYETALAARAADLVETGERRLVALLDACDVAWVDEDEWRSVDPDGRSFLDVDWPEDLHLIESRLHC